MCAQSESERVASSPAPCRLSRAFSVFDFLLVAVDQVTAARTHAFLRCFVSNHESAAPSCRHYRLVAVPVTLQVTSPAAPETKSPFIGEQELGQWSRDPQGNY
jgi:hypothetical protein